MKSDEMICPFKNKPCIHPDWADCQFEGEGKMGRNCRWLPKGISRTKMLESLGAFGEEAKRRALESLKRG